MEYPQAIDKLYEVCYNVKTNLKSDFIFVVSEVAMATYKTVKRECLIDFLKSHSKYSFTVREIAAEMSSDNTIKSVPSESTVYRLMREMEREGTVRRYIDPKNRE
ncbi:MAG TPA: hypothetical protein DDX72_04270 [Ruminococcaceae bacterium]|nr:hypothetical protein [Oscillospiraceae bacterium]